MGFDPQDKEIVRLLTKLKDADGKYPPELLDARRQRYLKQMGQIGLGTGVGAGLKNAGKVGKTPALSSATSTILESALLVAIVAETGTVAYFYRDKLAEVFHKITKESRVQEVSASPSPVDSGQEIQGVTPAPALSVTNPSLTLSASPTAIELSSTPIPAFVDENNTINTSSTQALNVNNGDNGNNGHHYGQTPKPERTKEPKNNNNNDKPPKDDSKPPKENSRPPRTR